MPAVVALPQNAELDKSEHLRLATFHLPDPHDWQCFLWRGHVEGRSRPCKAWVLSEKVNSTRPADPMTRSHD